MVREKENSDDSFNNFLKEKNNSGPLLNKMLRGSYPARMCMICAP